MADSGSQNLVEFRHGGIKPIRKLEEKLGFPLACSVDPKTGDLAVSNHSNYEGGSVLIFKQAHGTPVKVTLPEPFSPWFLGYDGSGNLFIDGYNYPTYSVQILKLEPGHKKAVTLTIQGKFHPYAAGGVQWDGKNLAVGDEDAGKIYRLRVSGSHATVGGITPLSESEYDATFTDFSIQGSKIIASLQGGGASYKGWVRFWAYPGGGHPLKGLKTPFDEPFGVVVSPGR
ncbi:MAG: hypothetical protein ABSF08_11195 [Candidatus Cybelea sp.]